MTASSNPSIYLRIPCNTKHVAMVRKCVRIIAESTGFNPLDCQDIEVAVAEAVTNAIIHGKPDNPAPTVSITCKTKPGYITIEVEDEGNTQCVPNPVGYPPESEEHGRGTLMIRQLMDEVKAKCTDKGLLLRMSKRCRPQSAERKHVKQDYLNMVTAVF